MTEKHYCLCGAEMMASGDQETLRTVAQQFWRSHERSGHGPTSAAKARQARVRYEKALATG